MVSFFPHLNLATGKQSLSSQIVVANLCLTIQLITLSSWLNSLTHFPKPNREHKSSSLGLERFFTMPNTKIWLLCWFATFASIVLLWKSFHDLYFVWKIVSLSRFSIVDIFRKARPFLYMTNVSKRQPKTWNITSKNERGCGGIASFLTHETYLSQNIGPYDQKNNRDLSRRTHSSAAKQSTIQGHN